jgi:hypothetical protein
MSAKKDPEKDVVFKRKSVVSYIQLLPALLSGNSREVVPEICQVPQFLLRDDA